MIIPFKDKQPKIHESAFVAGTAVLIGDVEIGEQASIWFGSILRGDVNFIRIGSRTNIQDGTVIHVSSKDHPTIIESDVTVGHRVVLHGCRVEPECLVGIGSILLDGVQVGRGSLVAAGSLLTPGTVIPPNSLVMGSPGRVKRPLTETEAAAIKENVASYVELAATYKGSG